MKSLFFAFFLLMGGLSASAQVDPCGCEPGPVPAVWATVNGVNITELDAQTVARTKVLHDQVIDARAKELDLQINSKLLDLEAAKLKKSVEQLLDIEVRAKTKQPTDADIAAFYDANKARLESQAGRAIPLSQVSVDIRKYLLEQNQETAAQAYAARLRQSYGVKKLIEKAPVPTTPADRQKVLATIGTVSIRSADIEDSLRPLIYSVQTELYRARKDSVDLSINDMLLQAEAKKRGITSAQLYEAEVTNKVPTVTDAQAQAFFELNKSRLNGTFATLKPQIVQFLTEKESKNAGLLFAQRLRNAAVVKYFFSEPVAPVYDIPAANHGSKGAPNSKVTLTVFTDYQCSTCAVAYPEIDRLLTEYNGRVQLVVYNYPLGMHADAFKAAEAAEAARAQGKFWEYVSLLYKNQSQLSVAKLKEYATAVGLDRKKFDSELDSGKYRALIDSDIKKGAAIGVTGTPTVFLNGRPLSVYRHAELKAAIDAALR